MEFKRVIFFIIFVGFCFIALAQTSSYRSSVFQGSTMNFKPRDYSILERSLSKMEKRKNEAAEQYLKLCKILGEYEIQLYNDVETRSWFSNYKQEIKQQFESMSDEGRWGEARNYVVRQIGRIATDSELMARISTAREYETIIEDLQKRTDMTQEEKRNWILDHPYCFIPIADSSGNIIGGRLGSKEELQEYKRKAKKQQ
ncbi:MAG: hypothetical protein J6I86_10110 [Bacteroidaceae bacterium]|nr:hypothetical protein [Bacteroidaceae bacterium]